MPRSTVSAREVTLFAAMLFIAAGVSPPPAHAYLDAGTGSMILQILIASAAAASFILKTQWRRIKAKLAGKPVDPKTPERNPGLNAQ